MRRLGSVFAVLFISAGLLGGAANAGASNGASVPSVKSLIGGKFRSVKTTGKKAIGDRQIRISFFNHSPGSSKPKKPTLSIRAGCNTWGGTFRIRRGRLSLRGPVSGTKMACAEDHDPWLRSKFRKGLKVRTRGNLLFLTRPAEHVRFVFKRENSKGSEHVDEAPDPEPRVTVPATEQDVHGKEYELIATIGKKLDRRLKLGFRDGLRSDGEGNLVPVTNFGFYAGCNHYGGEYSIEDGVLAWTEVLSTDMWCRDTDDDWLSRFLTGGPEIGLDGTDLVIRKDGIELVLAQTGESETPDPEPRVTLPATMEDLLEKSYEAISAIGPDLDRPLEIGFAMGTDGGGPGGPVTRPTFGYHAGCNHFGGSAAIEDGVLSWTDVVQTLIDCRGTQDEWLTPFFKNDPEIGLDGTDLVIRKNGVEIVFREIEK